MTMNKLCAAGVTQRQPINGPNDGEPEYDIPQQIYMRYIACTPPAAPLRNDMVNDTPPCQIDPALLEDNNYAPPQERSHRPKPRPLFGRNRTEDPAVASASAVVGSAVARPGNNAEGNTH